MNEATELIPTEDHPVDDLFARPDVPAGDVDPTPRDPQPDGTYASRSAPDGFVLAEAPGSAGAAPGDSSKEELLDLTKDELYEKAKEADISGRSSMNKAQLAEELASR